jgi:ABC-type branched-subunit amino acid transport system ATPase component
MLLLDEPTEGIRPSIVHEIEDLRDESVRGLLAVRWCLV